MSLSRWYRTAALAFGVSAAALPAVAGVVRGEVRDGDGRTVPEAVVVLEPTGDAGVRVAAATNRAGAFLFAAVRPASYEVKVETPGLVIDEARATARVAGQDAPLPVWEGRPTTDRPFRIEVSDGTAVEIRITVGEGVVLGVGDTRSAEAVLDEALGQIQAGACESAMETLERLIASAPGIPKAHYLVGFCRGAEGRVDDAIAALDRALELRPGFPGAAMLKGQILEQAGRHESAQAAFRMEIENATSEPMAREAWWGLGLSLRDSGDSDGALEAFSRAAEIGSGKPEAWIEVAELNRKSGQLDRAEAALDRAAGHGIHVTRARLNLGVARLTERQFRRAAEIFEAVASTTGESAEDRALAFGLLGKARLADGDRARAREAFRRSIEIDPDGPLADEARGLLRELGG